MPELRCPTGKIPYKSRSKAERAIKQQAARDALERKSRQTLAPYRCIRCLGWHIGHAHELLKWKESKRETRTP